MAFASVADAQCNLIARRAAKHVETLEKQSQIQAKLVVALALEARE